MGVETLAIIGAVAGGGAEILGGISAKKSADEEARSIKRQAGLGIQESEAEAKRLEREGEALGTKQKLSFLKNGVSLEGSPLLVLEDTRVETEKQVEAQRAQGRARGGLARRRASILKREGRAKLISGTLRGISSGVSGTTAALG